MAEEKKNETVYRYEDEMGNLLCEVVRFTPKGFTQRRPDGNGGRIYNLDGVRRVLYRLRELIAESLSEYTFMCEGEKDVNRLMSLGFSATTSPGGAGKWRPEYSEFLKGRNVICLPDNDAPGRKHMKEVAESVYGIAAMVKIVELPGLPPKGDVSDWLDAGHDFRKEIYDLIDKTPQYKSEKDKSGLVVIDMADVEGKNVEWLWPNRFPLGMLSIMLGDPGLGKSFLTLFMAATVSQGRQWPDGSPCPQGQVLIFCMEDSLEHTVKPRLQALGANTQTGMIRVIAAARETDENGNEIQDPFILTRHCSRLEAMLRANPGIRLVIIDPLSAYFGSTDTHVDAKVRSALAPLSQIADRHKVAVVCVMHPNKGFSANILHRASGSAAFTAVVRSMWFVCADPEDQANKRRFLLNAKMNVAEESLGLAFEMGKEGPVFEPEPIDISPAAILGKPSNIKSPKRDRAVDWLKNLLAGGESMPSKEIFRLAEENGINGHTLKKAKEKIRIKCLPESDEEGNQYWAWKLQGQEHELPKIPGLEKELEKGKAMIKQLKLNMKLPELPSTR